MISTNAVRRMAIMGTFVVLGVLFSSSGAYAAYTQIADLTIWNATNFGTDHVVVEQDGTSLRITWVAGSSGFTPTGIDKFYLNLDTPLNSGGNTISGPAGWSADYAPPPNQADGFGNFNTLISNGGATGTQFVFTLGSATALDGTEFAVHVRYGDQNCSGYAANRANAGTPGDAGCTSTPEPNSLVLLVASALFGLLVVITRRVTA